MRGWCAVALGGSSTALAGGGLARVQRPAAIERRTTSLADRAQPLQAGTVALGHGV